MWRPPDQLRRDSSLITTCGRVALNLGKSWERWLHRPAFPPIRRPSAADRSGVCEGRCTWRPYRDRIRGHRPATHRLQLHCIHVDLAEIGDGRFGRELPIESVARLARSGASARGRAAGRVRTKLARSRARSGAVGAIISPPDPAPHAASALPGSRLISKATWGRISSTRRAPPGGWNPGPKFLSDCRER
jgi:hypothetical protein